MQLIYLAGPMSKGPQFSNMREAMRNGTLLLDAGHAVIVPQLSFLWDLVFPNAYEKWLTMDMEIIQRCDLIIRLPGESAGADREVAFAREHNIPVFLGTADEFLARGRAGK